MTAFSIIGAVSGISAFILSIFSLWNSRFKVVSEYYSMDRDLKFVEARRKIYDLKDNEISLDSDIALVISYFHFWGLMVKKRHLPFYVFKSASGPSIMKLYDRLYPTITERRKTNPYYAEHFEWLHNKIRRYNAKKMKRYYR